MASVHLGLEREGVGCLTEVVHCPEGIEARRERPPYKVVVTVRVTIVLLGWVVDTRVGGVLGRVFLLTKTSFLVTNLNSTKSSI